jgi:hypothetical protein
MAAKVRNEPPPAIAFSTPPAKPASASRAKSGKFSADSF